ncbi:MAG: hypothetical protein K2J20_05495 [Bacilli bacterium]|nr:hypothetical protein [Bacilli bacterium]
MARNKLGQFTGTKPIAIKITKALQEIAKEAEIRVKPLVRDELVSTLRSEVYNSYRPATQKGREIKEHNETHTHQKKALYHHTGTLLRNIHGVIDGDTVKIIVDDEKYDDGSTADEVYDYLKFGTTDNPKKEVYGYANGTKISKYIAQEPHNFEARTREHMNIYLMELEAKINSGDLSSIPNLDKYIDKVARKNK